MSAFHPLLLAPTLASLLGGVLGTMVGARPGTLRQQHWGALAAVTAAGVASTALGAEYLSSGTTGGVAITGLGGLVGAAVTGRVLSDGSTARRRRTRERPDSDAPALGWPLRVAVCVAVAAVATGAAAVGLALAAVVALVLLAAVSLTRRGWPVSTAFFTVALVVSAAEVVGGRIVLSPLGRVGDPVPTVLVAAVTVAPLLIHLVDRRTWTGLVHRVGLLDAAAALVAVAAGRSWWATYAGLRDSQIISQLQRLGEDNASHLMMLMSTRASGTTLGGSPRSLEINSGFAGYFPGGSLWQAAVGALLPDLSVARLYAVSMGLLIALVAGAAASVAALVRQRVVGLTALAVVVVGIVGSRATLAMYEIGFPGQLLVAALLVGALALVLAESRSRRGDWVVLVGLGLRALATWWTWNLAAPIFLPPAAVLVWQRLRRTVPLPPRLLQGALAAGVLLLAVGVLVEHSRITETLDKLSLEGGVFRAIPFWFALGLGLGLPIAYRVLHRQEPASARALVLAMSAATFGLMMWQIARTGTVTYYSYKLEYLTLAVGWGAGALAVATVVSRVEVRWPLPVRVATAAAALVCVPALVAWPAQSYQDWLTARTVAGPDSPTTCAVEQAHDARGSIVLATGFGEKLANYLTTRAMDVGARNNDSNPFWTPILYDGPTAWPWQKASRPVVLVQGPTATPEETAAIVAAAAAQGVTVEVDSHRCTADG
jgi:hypothetical protein